MVHNCAFSETNRALLRRLESGSAARLQKVFTDDGDVKMFFFYFEDIFMRGKDNAEKSFELLTQLDEDAFAFFFDTFTVEGNISESGKNFQVVQNAFLERFVEKVELQDAI